MVYIPSIAAALFTVILAYNNREEIYTNPETASYEEKLEEAGGIKLKGILKYVGIFMLSNIAAYMLVVLVPIILTVIIIGSILSSLSFIVFFRV